VVAPHKSAHPLPLSRSQFPSRIVIRTLFLSVVPSPYQRDLFKALANRSEVEIKVCYLEGECRGYPWPITNMAAWETVLPGNRIDRRQFRVHWNTQLPDFSKFEVVVLNTYLTAITAQWVMRKAIKQQKWLFWGERLRCQQSRWRHGIQTLLSAPLHRAAGIAAIGHLAEQDYRKRFPHCRTFNIPYYCNLDPFLATPRRLSRDAEIHFLFCGVMNRRKGVDLLLGSFDRLVQVGAAVQLHLVGQEAELPGFLQGVSSQSRERIHFHGFQPPDKLPEFFALADVFVLPSRYDGWGVVVNQALGAGLPLVCSNAVGAAHDLVDPERNGLLFANENEASLMACLKRFVDAPELRDKWGAASREKAQQWLPEVGAAKWIDAIQHVRNAGT
jgi:glycosyltransferase involved in cell wall biosynthesis